MKGYTFNVSNHHSDNYTIKSAGAVG